MKPARITNGTTIGTPWGIYGPNYYQNGGLLPGQSFNRGFNYTSETHKADIGSLHLAVDETKHVDVPVWAGLGAILIGGALLFAANKRS
jgi:hypothetical protein